MNRAEILPYTPTVEGKGLEGRIQSVVYESDDGSFCIMRLVRDDNPEPVTIRGFLAGTSPGERVRLTGQWETHPKFGRQFKVDECIPLLPASAEGITAYLGSGLVPGVGPRMAERIVDRFGADTLRVIDEEPARLAEVQGFGKKRIAAITEAWQGQRGVRDSMLFLQSHGVSPGYATRIYRQYGSQTVQKVRENPYRLAQEIDGIGFILADRFARGLGFAADSPARAEAGILHALQKASDDGHCFLPSTDLLSASERLLECEQSIVEKALESLIEKRQAVAEPVRALTDHPDPSLPLPRAVYLPALHAAETGVAREIARLLASPRSLATVDTGPALATAQEKLSLALAPKQVEAVTKALSEKLLVITGGPGTGKTTIQRALLSVLSSQGARPSLAAPTGRAAKRLAEATGREAKTIHRLLEYMPREKRFRRSREEPLDCDILIVDEASMIDVALMHHLLSALPSQASLILVGDAHQLPSVGPGAVLADLIASGRLPVVELTEIFRQSAESRIVTNAHRINQGLPPLTAAAEEASDFYFIEQDDAGKAARTIVELVCNRIPNKFHLDPVNDVQVLSPLHRGDAGVESLNGLLQAALNPAGEEVTAHGRKLRAGDKVMQLRNDYERDVFNGDMGRLASVDKAQGMVTVDFDGRLVQYELPDLVALVPAYAISVHKAQGGEFPAVVVPLLTQHYPLLQRNLLYTAVTRGRRLVVLVGSRRALAIALRNDTPRKRYSQLAPRLAALTPRLR